MPYFARVDLSVCANARVNGDCGIGSDLERPGGDGNVVLWGERDTVSVDPCDCVACVFERHGEF
jgi:hypothetical protein